MTFCKLHSKPVFNDKGEHVGWTEPSIVKSTASVDKNGNANTMHTLECSEDWPMPNGEMMPVHCVYTADQMRADQAAAVLPAVEEVKSEVEPVVEEPVVVSGFEAAE